MRYLLAEHPPRRQDQNKIDAVQTSLDSHTGRTLKKQLKEVLRPMKFLIDFDFWFWFVFWIFDFSLFKTTPTTIFILFCFILFFEYLILFLIFIKSYTLRYRSWLSVTCIHIFHFVSSVSDQYWKDCQLVTMIEMIENIFNYNSWKNLFKIVKKNETKRNETKGKRRQTKNIMLVDYNTKNAFNTDASSNEL